MHYLGYRLFGVVGDSRQAVIGGFRGETGWGVFSDNPAVVLIATEYVRHDIAMQILGTTLGSEQVTELMRNNPEFIRLRASRSGGSTTWADTTGGAAPAARSATKAAARAQRSAPRNGDGGGRNGSSPSSGRTRTNRG
jgi:hypothetical protein